VVEECCEGVFFPRRYCLRHCVKRVQIKDTVGPIDAVLAAFFAGKNPMEASLDIENHRYVLGMISLDACYMIREFEVLGLAGHLLQMSCPSYILTSHQVDYGCTCTA
jgi:hypothetical protein